MSVSGLRSEALCRLTFTLVDCTMRRTERANKGSSVKLLRGGKSNKDPMIKALQDPCEEPWILDCIPDQSQYFLVAFYPVQLLVRTPGGI